MSVVFGENNYLANALMDPRLKKAHVKLTSMISEIRGIHEIVPPVGPTKLMARIMVDGDYDLVRRWSWRLHHGPIPEGHRIYVGCGERYCITPECLYAYKAEKRPKGDRKIVRPLAKLNWEKVEEIRRSGDAIDVLAERYDVHPTTIRSILAGKTWVRK